MISDHYRGAIAHHDDYLHYDFSPQHPLRPERLTAGLDLLETAGLWDPHSEHLVAPMAGDDELAWLHDRNYIRVVQDAGAGMLSGSMLRNHGLGSGDTPAFAGMHDAAARVAGGTIQAVRSVLSGRLDRVFNPGGGLHHALRDRGAGFCVYNDPALGAAVARNEFDARVLYVDLDCHHGDGVQWLWYDNPDVLTLSFHESGRYLFPGTGEPTERGTENGTGYSINVPFDPGSGDDSWIDAMEQIVPPVAERFRPDIIISAHGADTHSLDPLTHMELSTRSFIRQADMLHRISRTYTEGRWVATGSGGYEWRSVVPRSWSIVWSAMMQRPLPSVVPEQWAGRWLPPEMLLSRNFLDDAGATVATPARTFARNKQTLKHVRDIHGL